MSLNEEAIDESVVKNLLSWHHTGFRADVGREPAAEDLEVTLAVGADPKVASPVDGRDGRRWLSPSRGPIQVPIVQTRGAAVTRRGPKTADELMAELEADPAWVERRARLDREHAEAVAHNLRDEAPVVAALNAAGVPVRELVELYGRAAGSAVDILVSWLPKVTNRDVKMAMLRCLSSKAAKRAAPALIAEFARADHSEELGVRWTAANALRFVASRKEFDDLVRLVQDARYGRSREMLCEAIANTKDPRAAGVLRSLLSDPQLAGFAIAGLRKLSAAEARADIEPFLESKETWIRNEARKAIARFDKRGKR